ncbi:unnamed protein product [Rotaria socialis]|uniref:Uncharacterized protein n=1 Tax=Rotaria socialis TaxID=392032 RepID=A0A817ND48_9BILA|nr:unnamed protein product [Rotaria socialis]CAF3630670.1 unnamed protein product [Rotaria socialis]CAF4099129.1 unnamed protein product [Rotaria socialis]CAF4377306.1 unnamed protein product [Rotaria socialis]
MNTELDIVIANYDSESVSIFLGYGNGSFANSENLLTSAGSNSYSCVVTVRDYNNDVIQDIVVANQGTNNLGIFLGYGKGTFLSMILYPMGYGSRPFSIVGGDFSKDKKFEFCRSQ